MKSNRCAMAAAVALAVVGTHVVGARAQQAPQASLSPAIAPELRPVPWADYLAGEADAIEAARRNVETCERYGCVLSLPQTEAPLSDDQILSRDLRIEDRRQAIARGDAAVAIPDLTRPVVPAPGVPVRPSSGSLSRDHVVAWR
jgi:hypothetical protein